MRLFVRSYLSSSVTRFVGISLRLQSGAGFERRLQIVTGIGEPQSAVRL